MGNPPSLIGTLKLIVISLSIGVMEVIVGADGGDTPPPSVICHPFPPLAVDVVKYERAVPATEIVYLLNPASNTTLF